MKTTLLVKWDIIENDLIGQMGHYWKTTLLVKWDLIEKRPYWSNGTLLKTTLLVKWGLNENDLIGQMGHYWKTTLLVKWDFNEIDLIGQMGPCINTLNICHTFQTENSNETNMEEADITLKMS